ncbi:carboxymuconolactone decarboxylase family protein (plasmid) [Ralstonia solanacearum]|uniref:Carboxymuconolactone decarboxylase family protein n=1 Tax=Ralstonia chuxiongensis TaxID=2957504 RepID=A0AA42BK39_9RALS|nr:carboxymuconolactone decarboxylase family protein [Ralstonia chuxiongensis]MCP1175845.1 carboxymuconolactone decarboxylase family protein [Ralstonia chuxiongensis]QKL94791.1 carboxymuconolactone decarboxylase family protein [Ralstonia solanacearum]QKL99869.1 carboxymuconolactone decarboxylase family protein [Ralstonia solanacearum]QLR10927.1 carboxymuconolactone decarboxylase family protein [Ralstonia solanacearum]
MQLTDIDPAMGLMAEFGKLTHNTTRHINQMRQETIFCDGVLPARIKALAAMLWAISARCEPCFKFYVQQAVKLGATEHELGEMLAVASTMGGCVGEMWALKAFKAYKDIRGGQPVPDAQPICCQ